MVAEGTKIANLLSALGLVTRAKSSRGTLVLRIVSEGCYGLGAPA